MVSHQPSMAAGSTGRRRRGHRPARDGPGHPAGRTGQTAQPDSRDDPATHHRRSSSSTAGPARRRTQSRCPDVRSGRPWPSPPTARPWPRRPAGRRAKSISTTSPAARRRERSTHRRSARRTMAFTPDGGRAGQRDGRWVDPDLGRAVYASRGGRKRAHADDRTWPAALRIAARNPAGSSRGRNRRSVGPVRVRRPD